MEHNHSALPVELWHTVFRFLNLAEVLCFSGTCRCYATISQRYIQYRRALLLKPFFANPNVAYSLLDACQTVLSGSCALHLLLPEAQTCWRPQDLDFYVSHTSVHSLLHNLKTHEYEISAVKTDLFDPYPNSHIHSVITLHHHSSKIDVIVSTNSSPVSPIFQFHSTALINFITSTSIFCAYPQLTLQQLSLVNPFVVYGQALKRSTLMALLKYNDREIAYTSCAAIHNERECWKNHIRSVDDNICLWIPSTFPHSRPEKKYPIRWCLGGAVCRKMPPYIPPYVAVET